jgi:hypothetical protein
MAAKKSVPVRLKTGTYIHKEKRNGKEEDVVYKAHDEKCNVIFVGVAEAKELLERFVNKFEIINEIEYKAPEQPDSEPETEEVEEEVETPAGGDEDYGTEVTKSFDESKGTKCKVYIKNDLYTVIGPEGEVIKQGVNENSARKSLKKMQPTE